MLQFISNLISPFFLGLGVAQTDIDSYLQALSGYIYAIIGLFVLAVAVMIAAHWFVKKGTRHVVRWAAGLSWVMITTIIANVICYGPMYNNIAPILNGQAEVSEESMEASKDIIEEVGEEGIVLLKNDGTLPLTGVENINVFGWASIDPVLNGAGSGSADTSDAVGIIESLETAGFKTNTTLSDFYKNYATARIGRTDADDKDWMVYDWTLFEPPVSTYTDEMKEEAKEFSDTAMVVISRSGGEGRDEPTDMKAAIDDTYDPRNEGIGTSSYDFFDAVYTNNGDYDDYQSGETYLELSQSEKDMIDMVCADYENVIVVINANNAMELGWVDEYPQIGSVLLVPGTGETGMLALGSILKGEVNPSGRTADTYVYDLNNTPTSNNFGSFLFNNTQELQDAVIEADSQYAGVIAFVNYVEGIYVGYRFYETAAEEGLIDYDTTVQYPFGYGLSYTSFEKEMVNFNEGEDGVTFDVTVTNTGDTAGKDVVEIYYNPPYYNGGIEKASVNLIDFEKTDLLQPGESQTISFAVDYEDLASYDSTGIKVDGSGYILEAGDYEISVRSDSHTEIASETFTIDQDIDYSVTGRESDDAVATNQFEDYSAGNVTYLSRKDSFANYEEATAAPSDSMYVMDDETYEEVKAKTTAYYDPTLYDNADDEMPVTGADNGLKLADFVGVSYDDPQWDDLLDQLTVEDLTNMVNLGGFQTVAVESVGKVATQDSDGTAGLNDWYIQVYGTAYPVELLIAQTWNKDLAYRVGQAEGAEYASAGIYGTYSPAMNIHRSAFGGRNFEYYSEDPMLSGYMASNTVTGLATQGVYAYIKHFAMNDQEGNRCTMLLTYADEQAIREIYLKPFEICVKNNAELGGAAAGYPMAVMSSFNFIGAKWCGANSNLLNNVLRDEWGYRGFVLTDWDGSYGYQNTDDCVRNGNDAMLGFYWYDSNIITDTDSATLVQAMRTAAKNIMYTTVNSGNYTMQEAETGMDNMTKLFVTIDVIIGALIVIIMAIVLVRWMKKRKVS